jgi:cell division protein FtsL
MVRILNFLCVALMGLSILGLYHVSEEARVARVKLNRVESSIAQERATTSVLQAEWERVAGPARIQSLAQARLGMADNASVQLSALELLPRRGDDATESDVKQASAQAPQPAPAASPELTQVAAHTGY